MIDLVQWSEAEPSWEPWGREMAEALARSHDLILANPDRPFVDQVAERSVDAVVDASTLASPELAAAAAGHVRLWQLGSVGYDNVDVKSLAQHGIPTANSPGFTSSKSLAEQALMLAMMVMRDAPGMAAAVEAGTLGQPTGRQLAGLTLAIIGFGSSGRELARRAVAFGLRVIAIGRREPDEALVRRFGLAWTGTLERLDEALAASHVVGCTCR